MSLRSTALAAAFAAALVMPLVSLGGRAASAAAYAFTSSGSFANASDSAISSSGAKLGWGGSNSINSIFGYNGSTMTAVAISGSGSTLPASTVKIGELDWLNKATSSENTAATVTATYNLALNFTLPGPGGTNTNAFALTITNTTNNVRVCFFFICSNTGNVDDTAKLSGYSPSLVVDGLLISNITFAESGDGAFNAASRVWSNPEGELSKLSIYADITTVAVPEPLSLSLLGAGLVGLGLIRRRRRS